MGSFTVPENATAEEIAKVETLNYMEDILKKTAVAGFFLGSYVAFMRLAYHSRRIMNRRWVSLVMAATSFSTILGFIWATIYVIQLTQTSWHFLIIVPLWIFSVSFGTYKGYHRFDPTMTIPQLRERMKDQMKIQMTVFLTFVAMHCIVFKYDLVHVSCIALFSVIISIIFYVHDIFVFAFYIV